MQVTIVGSGDAFGSGGRLNTCFHVAGDETNFLVDCGATSLPALKRLGIDLNAVSTIFVTHFHGDHFGGIPFVVLDAQFVSKRTTPLTVAGPEGTGEWFVRSMETAFRGSSEANRKFETGILELEPGKQATVNGVSVTPQLVRHGQPDGRFFAYRFEIEGRVFAYSGDTEWTEALIEVGREADLFICESYAFDKKVPLHLDYRTLSQNLPRIAPKRCMLTHMSEAMLARADEAPEEKARDGLVVEL